MNHPQIYVSSSCSRARDIKVAVQELAGAGFRFIELSGGCNYREQILEDLLDLQQQFQISFRCHNYFPPPPVHFVLNLSALDDGEYQRSIQHVQQAIGYSAQLGAKELGIHAGFRIQPAVSELGHPIASRTLAPYSQAIQRFSEAWLLLSAEAAAAGVTLFVENNVFSAANAYRFAGNNPFLATDVASVQDLLAPLGAPLLLDVAHLHVSCKTLGLDFSTQMQALLPQSRYLHLSDNDGLEDSNEGLHQGSTSSQLLQAADLRNKTMTLEVYADLDTIADSYQQVEQWLCGAGA